MCVIHICTAFRKGFITKNWKKSNWLYLDITFSYEETVNSH